MHIFVSQNNISSRLCIYIYIEAPIDAVLAYIYNIQAVLIIAIHQNLMGINEFTASILFYKEKIYYFSGNLQPDRCVVRKEKNDLLNI